MSTLSIIFLFAFVQRINHLDNSRHVAEAQYRSALIARSIFFNLSSTIPEWRKQANSNSFGSLSQKNLLVREPLITELFAAAGYTLLGQEDLIIPRLFTSVFWLVEGFFLYKIAKDWVSYEGAIVAVAYY